MEIETNFNGSLFGFNDTTSPGQNHSLQFPLPAWTIATLTICCVGIMANSFVISVVTISSLRTSVFMNLVMILAIFDILYLLAVIHGQIGIFGQFLIEPSVVHCSLNNYLLYVCGVVSSWVTVLISLDRYIVIYFPLKGHIYCTKKRSCSIVVALFIISCSWLVPMLFISKITLTDQGPSCSLIWNGPPQMLFLTILLIFYSIVPGLCMVLLNILIIRKLKVQRAFRVRSQMQHSESHNSNNNSQVIIMVFICSVFVVTSFPSTIVVFAYFSTSVYGYLFSIQLFYFANLLDTINHSVNFFLYCLTGSFFRNALFQLVKCKNKEYPEDHSHQQISISQTVL